MATQKRGARSGKRARDTGAGFMDVAFRTEPTPGARFRTGLTVYDEALDKGRWVGRCWQGAGFIERESTAAVRGGWIDVAMQAFGLEMDGQALHFGWDYAGARMVRDGRAGTRHAVVELVHQLRPVRVAVHTRLDGTPVIARWLEVTNTSDRPSALCAVWPWSGLLMDLTSGLETGRGTGWRELLPGRDGPVWSVGYFVDDRWGGEGDFRWQALSPGVFRIESRTGKSGHGCPFFVVRNEATGEQAIGHLGWSGNWAIELTCDLEQSGREARLVFRAGPQAPGPMRVLDPGETVATPEVHLGYAFGDLDQAVQTMHMHLRRSVLQAPVRTRDDLVIYNHWSYTQHEMTEDALRHEIDVAADLGAELFIIDAGWYADRGTNWWSTTGDWTPGDRLPQGVKPIRAYARKKGLLFGLWMDAERIGVESRIHKEHPEWLLRRYGEPTDSDLDLGHPEAAAWLEAEINRVVEEYELDLFRLDYNTMVYEGGQRERHGYLENNLWRHYEVVYGIYDRLRQRFPKLVLENCSGGGGRTDIGMVRRFSHTWVTDWQIAPRSMRIINGMTLALPPEYVDRNIGVCQEGHTRADLDFQWRTVLFGRMTISGVHPRGARPNPDQIGRIKHGVRIYKDFIRPMHRTSRLFHHTPELPGREPHGWGVLELASADATRALVGLFRLAGPAEPEYHLRLRGLDVGRRYRVTFDNTGQTMACTGADLMHAGLTVRLDRALSSELVLVTS